MKEGVGLRRALPAGKSDAGPFKEALRSLRSPIFKNLHAAIMA
jgi:hypothetical protein